MASGQALGALVLMALGLGIILPLFYFGILTSILTSVLAYLDGMKENLIPNLISESISIVITVLIIQRIIQWRDERRWKEARKLFRLRVREYVETILKECEQLLKKIDSSASSAPRLGALPLESSRGILRGLLGEPMGSIVADKTPLAKSPASPYFMKTALWIMPLENSCMAGNIFSSNFLYILTFGCRTDNACTCSYQDFSGLLL